MIDADERKWLGQTPRMAAYRVGANGRSAAEIGLAAALARNSSARTGNSLRLAAHRARAKLPEGVQAARQRHDAREARRNGGNTSARAAGLGGYPQTNTQSVDASRALIIQSANDTERKRWATVLAHEASQGREKMAIHLLGHAYGFSASQIIAGLQGTANGPSQAATTTWGKAESWDVIRADVLERTGRA